MTIFSSEMTATRSSTNHRPWIDLRDAHVASYILSMAERGYTVHSFAESVNSLENSTGRNQDGRIVRLKLDFDTQDEHASLPSEVEQLEQLEHVELWGCKRLPTEIGSLFKMVYLKLNRCFGLQNFPSTSAMKSLTHLSINSLPHSDFAMLMTQIGRLPMLEILALNYVSFNSNDIDSLLLQKDNAFRDTLVELNLYGNEVDQRGLATLLWNVLPKFPNLKTIDLGRNDISSLDPATFSDDDDDEDVADGHSNRKKLSTLGTLETNSQSRLEKLQLKYNPIWYDAGHQSQQALLHILERHVRLGWLGDHFENSSPICTPLILHHLDLNRCGRVLIDGTCSSQQMYSRVSDSVWPVILERTNRILVGNGATRTSPSSTSTEQEQRRIANAIFYLISNGPAFANRSGGNKFLIDTIQSTRSHQKQNDLEIRRKPTDDETVNEYKCFNEKSAKEKFMLMSDQSASKRRRYA